MGQKVHPVGFRLAVNKDWQSRWFAKKGYADFLIEDLKIRDFIKENFSFAAIPRIDIDRAGNRVRLTVHTARPGIIIGRKGVEIDRLKERISELTDNKNIFIDIAEVNNPEARAQLIAENVALQLKRRIAFRRAMKRAVQNAVNAGVDGIKIRCAGRLGGSEMKRRESYKWGKIPLHTLRAPIDYGFTEAKTSYGVIGVKVWVCRKEEEGGEKSGAPAEKDKA